MLSSLLAWSAPLLPQLSLPATPPTHLPGKPTVTARFQRLRPHKGTHRHDYSRLSELGLGQGQGTHPHMLLTDLTRLNWVLISG